MSNDIIIGDTVTIQHQPEHGECVVVNMHDVTDSVVVGMEEGVIIHTPVEYYIRVDTPTNKNQGYHYWNVEKVNV